MGFQQKWVGARTHPHINVDIPLFYHSLTITHNYSNSITIMWKLNSSQVLTHIVIQIAPQICERQENEDCLLLELKCEGYDCPKQMISYKYFCIK